MSDDGVRVILDQLHALREHLVRVEARVDAVHDTATETKHLARQTNGRVRKLELWRATLQGAKEAVGWRMPAVTAFGSALVGAVVTAVAAHFIG